MAWLMEGGEGVVVIYCVGGGGVGRVCLTLLQDLTVKFALKFANEM